MVVWGTKLYQHDRRNYCAEQVMLKMNYKVMNMLVHKANLVVTTLLLWIEMDAKDKKFFPMNTVEIVI